MQRRKGHHEGHGLGARSGEQPIHCRLFDALSAINGAQKIVDFCAPKSRAFCA
ncbi:hypothetical protein J4457_02390 [Candidatus Woesearchaeota archaeon]|nr:hypothetical protein [Candidatus Woesearchaeota archaeon]